MTGGNDPKDRNWEREMQEVDRLLGKLPAAEPNLSAQPRPTPTAPRPAVTPPAPPGGGEWLGTWVRVALGLAVGVGMTQWPYSHGCGLRLGFYLCGVLAVFAAGIWGALSSWQRRLGLAHILSLLVVAWGLALAAGQILPRVGYARTTAPWLCPDVTPARR